MKKLSTIFCVIILSFVLLSTSAFASAPLKVLLDWEQVPIEGVIENGRALVPMRAIFEILGANVEWIAETKTIIATKDGTELILPIGSTTATVNGSTETLDVPAKIVNGVTWVPLRFVGESLGIKVEWENDTIILDTTMRTYDLIDIETSFGELVEEGLAALTPTILTSADTSTPAGKVLNHLISAGLPIISYIEYNAETDPNELLGRPNQYTGKINFVDSRSSYEEPCKIEIFENNTDAQSRADYVNFIGESLPLFAEYIFVNKNMILRIEKSLTPEQAQQYKDAFYQL